MKALICILTLTLLPQPARAAAQESAVARPSPPPVAAARVLRNEDVVEMLRSLIAAEVIIAKIKSSACDFDTSTAGLLRLKSDEVPEAVILAMVAADTTREAAVKPQPPKPIPLKIPAGTTLEIEVAHAVNSYDFVKGDIISFRVASPVMVGGVTVIAQGASARGRVVEAKRGGHFGRAGRLAWTMQDVMAVDGTRVPLNASGRLVGDSKGAKVATKTIVTGVILWPIAPIALLHGFKRGENAQLPAGKLFEVQIQADATINAPAPR